MIKTYKIEELGYDMMGYIIEDISEISFHHLLVPRIYGGPISRWNGALLCRNTAHNYLHLIEHTEPDIFYGITKELCEEKDALTIRLENLRRIREYLLEFESRHERIVSEHGKTLTKREYKDRRIPL